LRNRLGPAFIAGSTIEQKSNQSRSRGLHLVGLSLDLLIRRDSLLTLVNISLGMVPTLMLDVGFLAMRMLVSCDANGSSQNVVSPVKRGCGDYVYPVTRRQRAGLHASRKTP